MGAERVPQNQELESEDAWETLRRASYFPLLKKALSRFREADGYTYARAVGLQVVLTTFPALIFFVAISVWTGSRVLQSSVEGIVASLSPGPASGFMQRAVEQGQQNAQQNIWAIVLGGGTALISGAVGMSQIQRGAARVYGKDEDRPWLRRYGLSLLLSLSAGLLLAGAFVAIAFGDTVADAVEGESIWSWLRWPLGGVGAVVAIAVLYKFAPNRRQPSVSWLMAGGLTATVFWLVPSGALALLLALSSTFGETYGPLTGLIGFLIWAQLTAFALLGGLAFTAQLEAERVKQDGTSRGRELTNPR